MRTESLERPKACGHCPQGLYAKVCLGLDRQPPCRRPSAQPVDNSVQIGEALCDGKTGYVCDVGGADLVGPDHRQPAQYIGVGLAPLAQASTCSTAGISPQSPQPPPAPTHAGGRHSRHRRQAGRPTSGSPCATHTGAAWWVGSIQRWPWQIANASAANPQLPRLPDDRPRVRPIGHRFAVGNRTALPSAPDTVVHQP